MANVPASPMPAKAICQNMKSSTTQDKKDFADALKTGLAVAGNKNPTKDDIYDACVLAVGANTVNECKGTVDSYCNSVAGRGLPMWVVILFIVLIVVVVLALVNSSTKQRRMAPPTLAGGALDDEEDY